MAADQGYQTQLGIDTANPITARFDYQRESLALDETFLDGNGLRGTRSHNVDRMRAGNRIVRGQLVLQPNAAELALLYPWILGAVASGTTFALADALTARYVTIDRVTKVYTYSGVQVDKATFRGAEGEPLTLTLDLIGVDETVGNAASFPSLSIDTATGPFLFSDLALSIASNTYTAKEVEITISNKLDPRYHNSQTITSLVPTDREITLKTKLPHSSAYAAYNTGIGGAAVTATFTNGTVSSLFSFVKVCFPRKSATVEGRSEILIPLDGVALKSGSTAELIVTHDSTV
jgi:hypothetical protein